jgi:hypothetical protein
MRRRAGRARLSFASIHLCVHVGCAFGVGRGAAADPAAGKAPRAPPPGTGGATEANEAIPGTAVRVGEGARKKRFAGIGGTIERSFGAPEQPALDIRLEDGRRELFWFHQLDRAEED